MAFRKFKQVDVFTSVPFRGNPVAVVLEAEGITPGQMQQMATWTNLSETTFLLPPTTPEADYRLRIFTPGGEVPFAGHPTLGSAHAILEAGLVQPKAGCMVQECGSGLLPLRVEEKDGKRRIYVRAPQAKITPLPQPYLERVRATLGAGLTEGVTPLIVDVGPVWLVVQLADPQAIHTLKPDLAGIAEVSRELKMDGYGAFVLTGDKAAPVYLRSFAPAVGVPEDPVCGSGNASVAAYLDHYGLLKATGRSYTANQGHEIGRKGVISVQVSPEGAIEIGGSCVTVIDGVLGDSN